MDPFSIFDNQLNINDNLPSINSNPQDLYPNINNFFDSNSNNNNNNLLDDNTITNPEKMNDLFDILNVKDEKKEEKIEEPVKEESKEEKAQPKTLMERFQEAIKPDDAEIKAKTLYDVFNYYINIEC